MDDADGSVGFSRAVTGARWRCGFHVIRKGFGKGGCACKEKEMEETSAGGDK